MKAIIRVVTTPVRHTARAVAHPVRTLSDVLHGAGRFEREHHRHTRFVIGTAFMLVGSGIAVSSGSLGLPHFGHVIVDMVAYGIHGCGAVPFVDTIIKIVAIKE